jgi:DNA invertase Pin-like site-specific DNA recombinase
MKAFLYLRASPNFSPATLRTKAQAYLDEFNIKVIEEFVERSGTKGFPALERCMKAADGRLVIISNMNQLYKNVTFLHLLKQIGHFAVIENPDCRPDTIDKLIATAQELARLNSIRSKEACGRRKKKGLPMGSAIPGNAGADALVKAKGKGPKNSAKIRHKRTEEYYKWVMPRIIEMRKRGVSYENIARVLNEEGQVMQNGKPYHEVAVLRIKQRWEKKHGKIAPEYDKMGRRYNCPCS